MPTFGKSAFVEYDTERAVGLTVTFWCARKPASWTRFSTSTICRAGGLSRAGRVDVQRRGQSHSPCDERRQPQARTVCGPPARDKNVYRAANVKALAAADRWGGGKGDPIGIIEGGIEAVRNATGLRPNLMTMGPA